jgi:hypothetical protein
MKNKTLTTKLHFMKKVIFMIVIIFISVIALFVHEKKKNEDVALQCHLNKTEEININQHEIIPYSPFLIKL